MFKTEHFLHFRMTPSVPFKQIPTPHRVKNSYFYSHLLAYFLCFKKIVQTKKYNMYSIVSGWKHRRYGFHPWVGKIPWGKNRQPTPVYFPGKSHGLNGETVETVSDFIFWGSKIAADGDCSHKIKRCLLLGKKKENSYEKL